MTTRILLPLAVLLALAGCAAPATTASTPPPAISPAATSPAASTPSGAGASCTYAATGGAAREVEAPPVTGVANSGTVDYVIALNGEDVTVALDRQKTPCTVNSFVSLAAQGYFDGTACHRLVDGGIFVLQCGDPSGTGSGGPGYQFADELAGTETYGAGTLAMANAGPGTNGSQFFIVYADSPLSPDYTVFGTVTDGLDVVEAIAAGGQDNSFGAAGGGKPNLPAEITAVRPA